MTVVYDKQANLADPREINLCFYTNPTSLAIVGYRTTVDPATVSEKLNPGSPPAQIQIAEIDGNILGAWAEDYGTGTDDAKVWHKADVPADAPAPIIVYDRTPLGDDEDSEDDEHKTHVTDITNERGTVMYMLFAGASTPSEFELASDSEQFFNNVFPMGPKEGTITTTDTPVYNLTFVSCSLSGNKNQMGAAGSKGVHRHEFDPVYQQGVSESCVPPYYMLKMIRSTCIKSAIPKDAVIIFDGSLPSGFTRLSSADSKYIRTGATVGETGGNATRRIFCEGYTGSQIVTNAAASSFYLRSIPSANHYHYYGGYTGYIDNTPPYIDVILAQADYDMTFIPAGAIMMFDSIPPSDDWDVIDFDGRLLRGSSIYGGTGGNETVTPGDVSITTSQESGCIRTYLESHDAATGCGHTHTFVVNVGTIQTYPKCRQVIFAKAKHDISVDGQSACVIANDVYSGTNSRVMDVIDSTCGRHIAIRNKGNETGELHCVFTTGYTDLIYHSKSTDGGKTWSTKARVDDSFAGPQLFSDMVVDKDNNIHIVWAEYGESGHRCIKYRRLSAADVWGSVEQVSTAGNDYHQVRPCIQVKNDGVTIGVVWTGKGWGTDVDIRNVAYRERSTSSWGAEVAITNDAASNYDYPSIDYDTDDYPHIMCDNSSYDIYYWYKTAAGWQAREQVNLEDINNADFPSNILIDPNNNIHIAYRESTNHHIRYKTKSRGGSWPTIETVATGTPPYSYSAPQLQINSDGSIYCCYTKQTYVGTWLAMRTAAYKVKTTTWSSETILAESDATSYVYCQLMWSRLPLKDGVFQQQPQQGLVAISLTHTANNDDVGSLIFLGALNSVVGAIESEPTIKTYPLKRRGAICLSKINGPLAAPALIS